MLDTHDLDSFEPVARIVVIGIGGAGNNAVNRMIDEDIRNVEFYVANTDKQALSLSKAPNRIILGENITGGLGAGGDPQTGKDAAEASTEEIREIVRGANMVFIAAGMGGGTGTGAAPVISKIAKDEGALTVAIVTRPFTFEGKKKVETSIQGLNELRKCCDALIVVSNDKLLLSSGNSPISAAFSMADGVLSDSVKTVTDLILMPAFINLDFADVRATLKDSGVALIGFGSGSGPNNAIEAAESALSCPLIEQSIQGAQKAICHITCGPKVSLLDCQTCVDHMVYSCGGNLDLKFGISVNDQLDDQIMVSIIAGDFNVGISKIGNHKYSFEQKDFYEEFEILKKKFHHINNSAPTWFSKEGSGCIDSCFYSNSLKLSKFETIPTKISDHYPIYMEFII